MFIVKFCFAIVLLFPLISSASVNVGFKEIKINEKTEHPLNIAIWYPAKSQKAKITVADNAVFYGSEVMVNAIPIVTDHQYPLILLSHGYGGSWRNLSWLAYELSSQGYIVAAPTHHDTSQFYHGGEQFVKLWLRPQDLSTTINAVTADRTLASIIDKNKIAAIGHSLGGWTVIAFAGARFDSKQFQQDCRIHANLKACQLISALGLNHSELNNSMQDTRIKAFIALDAGLSRGFAAKSLQALRIPSLIIGAGVDVGDMDVNLESGYLQQFLPKPFSTYVVIPDAMHFSFMQICKSGAIEQLNQQAAGEGILCKDGGNRYRAEIHREITYLITGFLSQTFAHNAHLQTVI